MPLPIRRRRHCGLAALALDAEEIEFDSWWPSAIPTQDSGENGGNSHLALANANSVDRYR
ncbi:hypothetical protein MAXJ12_13361 [Mesorhizobium alhagi CCNWXJ12-2]|uniref:Uncharacterized protein n=1 Tax=Mesorhizobium alhagi CCNWXJ12-2 TaxID=1107882 RepID=H0HR87_9HYPH|nr:hypothetical protein MAXJ12_13361 [Mesorhizobium alhagi CCNWXJ12-2]